jgi:predicted MFS family arabinose efflux permease
VAAPTIRTDLDAGGSALQLVISGYTISYAVLLITGARLGERWGFSRVFQAGVALFTVASLACGLAPTVEFLIAFRVLQGIGSALMVPQVMSLIQRTHVGPARVRALGAYTAVLATGMVVGQILGGVLVTADLFGTGWRPVFLLNVPVGVILLIAGSRELPSFPPVHRSLDLLGLMLLSAAVFLLVVPLVLGHEQHWPVRGYVMLAGSGLALAGFVLVERRIGERGGSPLIRGRVLHSPGLAAAVTAIFLIMTGVGGFLFAFALHLQSGLGESALRVGLTFGPMAAGFGLAGLWWRRLPAWTHPRLALPALVLCAAGYALVGRSVASGDPISALILAVMLLIGVLTGCSYGQLFASALSRVQVEDAADASGVMVTLIQLGQVIGVAGFGTLYLSTLTGPLGTDLLGGGPADSGHAAELAALGVAVTTLAAGLISTLRPRSGQV